MQAREAPDVGVSRASMQFVLRGMHEVVNGRRGTARAQKLDIPDITMAGKTGTSRGRRSTEAERAAGLRKNEEIPWKERDHALFVAFAPYEAPRYAVAVIVEHGGSGGRVAAPIARQVMDAYLLDKLQLAQREDD